MTAAPAAELSEEPKVLSVLDAYAWCVEYTHGGAPVRQLMFCNGVGDYRMLDPQAISKPLFTKEHVEALLKSATQRAEAAERDALERAAKFMRDQADHIKQNAENLRHWPFEADEARCRELAGMYLRECANDLLARHALASGQGREGKNG